MATPVPSLPTELALSTLPSRSALPLEHEVELPKEERAALEEEDEFAEGGLQGWLNVLGAFLTLMVTFGYVASFGVYQSYYQTTLYPDRSPSDISWIGSTAIGLETFLAFVTGPIFDRGYFRPLLTCGSLLTTFALFMTSLSHTYWQTFLAQAVCLGIGLSGCFMPAISVLAHYFKRRRSLVMGIAFSGSSVGGIVFPILLNHLFPRIGFAQTVRASAYLVGGVLLLANLLLRSRYPPDRLDSTNQKVVRPTLWELLREPRYFLATLGITLISWGVFFPITYLQVFAEHVGLTQNISNNIVAILSAASFFGRILPSLAADSYGSFNLLTSTSGVSAVLIFALYGATTAASVVAFSLLFGFFSGGFIALQSPVLISTANHLSEVGVRQGLACGAAGVAVITAGPIAGALLDAGGGNFKFAIAFGGGIVALGTLCMTGARRAQAKHLGRWRV